MAQVGEVWGGVSGWGQERLVVVCAGKNQKGLGLHCAGAKSDIVCFCNGGEEILIVLDSNRYNN